MPAALATKLAMVRSMSTIIVVTSINRPTNCLIAFAEGAAARGAKLLVAGDRKSPPDFRFPDVEFISLDAQIARFPEFAALLPHNTYARKNIGYLAAIQNGATLIIDTDDDNAPLPAFWQPAERTVRGRVVARDGWVNAYSYFTDRVIWPRGFPLEEVHNPAGKPVPSVSGLYRCPIQQGLADENPDVDAIYRLLFALPMKFATAETIVLEKGSWCPFNSQNTRWWPEVFPLLYLPAHCSFRMTDIWRSFVAQRILWENDWRLSFHSSTVYQQRNEHNLIQDFQDEVSGYLNNARIRDALGALNLRSGLENYGHNLHLCYSSLVALGVIGREELPLLRAWITATDSLSSVKI
jgi:hypothetical protein